MVETHTKTALVVVICVSLVLLIAMALREMNILFINVTTRSFTTEKPRLVPEYADAYLTSEVVLSSRSQAANVGALTEKLVVHTRYEDKNKRTANGTNSSAEDERDKPPLPKYEHENGAIMFRDPPKSGVRLPWIQDIVLSEDGSEIVFTSIDRKACDCTLLNRSRAFNYLRSKDPSLTGPGECGEYVPTDPQIVADDATFGKTRFNTDVRFVSIQNGIRGTRLATTFACSFGDTSMPAQIVAYPFHGITYRCGVPSDLTSKRAVEFKLTAPSIDERPDEKLPLVARKAFDSSSVLSTQAGEKHEIAICSQSNVFTLDRIPEWVVFHLQAGVKHVFMYDQSKDGQVCVGLKHFIEAGQVTCVLAPYTGCDRGKTVRPFDMDAKKWGGIWTKNVVNAPHEIIEGIMIMTSCYARFSQFAEWMGFWDIDEFAVPIFADSYQQLIKPFANNQSVHSIGFRPAFYRPPSSCGNDWDRFKKLWERLGTLGDPQAAIHQCTETAMYHLGSWCLSSRGPDHQKKQLFKTSHVCAVNYHYMNCLHTKNERSMEVLLDYTVAILQHFKLPEKWIDSKSPPRFCGGYFADESAARWLPKVKSAIHRAFPEIKHIAPAKPSCCR